MMLDFIYNGRAARACFREGTTRTKVTRHASRPTSRLGKESASEQRQRLGNSEIALLVRLGRDQGQAL
jgi:hypothetical protein